MKLTRLTASAILALALLAAPLAAEAQPADKLYRIGWLHTGQPPDFGPPNPRTNLGAFRQGLFELGYVEGRTFVIEGRFADAKVDRLPALAAELVALQVDVIVAANTHERPSRQGGDGHDPHRLHRGQPTRSGRGSWRASPGLAGT